MLQSAREWARFLLKRIGILAISLLGVSMITFAVTHAIGNPVSCWSVPGTTRRCSTT